MKEWEIANLIRKNVDLRPSAIIERLNLRRPIYRDLSSYGHFGREGYSWEELDLVDKFL